MSEERGTSEVSPELEPAAMVLLSVHDDQGPFEKIGTRLSYATRLRGRVSPSPRPPLYTF